MNLHRDFKMVKQVLIEQECMFIKIQKQKKYPSLVSPFQSPDEGSLRLKCFNVDFAINPSFLDYFVLFFFFFFFFYTVGFLSIIYLYIYSLDTRKTTNNKLILLPNRLNMSLLKEEWIELILLSGHEGWLYEKIDFFFFFFLNFFKHIILGGPQLAFQQWGSG